MINLSTLFIGPAGSYHNSAVWPAACSPVGSLPLPVRLADYTCIGLPQLANRGTCFDVETVTGWGPSRSRRCGLDWVCNAVMYQGGEVV